MNDRKSQYLHCRGGRHNESYVRTYKTKIIFEGERERRIRVCTACRCSIEDPA